jgi:1-acyl-sn-glycerol-3-phosphate acyltransferase
VLFPEGTSSDGSRVLPFMSSLLEPAAAARCPVAAAHLAFAVDDGDPAQEVCYWADMTLVPHLLNLLAHGRVQARVRCVVQPPGETSRKALARQLHREVLRLAGLNTAPERPASEISPQGDFVSETRAQPAM